MYGFLEQAQLEVLGPDLARGTVNGVHVDEAFARDLDDELRQPLAA